jgi:pilus assembly protein FimV
VHRIIPFLILIMLSAPAIASVSLGDIEVRSYLNQPLQAQIRVQGSALTDDRLEIRLASEEAYRRAGLTRGAVPADLAIQLEGTGTSRIVRLTTQRPVREPYVGLLLEARWGAGRVLREYTILLDPPVAFAPERSVAPVVSRSVEPAPRPTPAAAPAPTARTEFGPRPVARTYMVRPGDSLGAIVRGQGYADVTAEQAMLAILEANPRAFVGGNVNQLLAGAELVMPSEEAVARLSSQSARQEIRRQTAEWRDRTVPRSPPPTPTPTQVAEATPPETAPPEDAAPETESDPAPRPEPPEPPEPAAPSDDREDEAAATVLEGPELASADRLEILSELDHGLGASDGASAQVMEEALLSQQTAMSELREELISLRAELTERDQLISVVNAELAQLEQRMRELQEQREGGSLGGTSALAMHERILADPLLLLLAATSVLLFLLLLVSLFRPVRSQLKVVEPMPARLEPEPPAAAPAARAADPARDAPDASRAAGASSGIRGDAGAVAAGVAAAAGAAAAGAATKGEDSATAKPPGDIDAGESGEDDLLADVDLYLAYGMNEQAISALENAIRDGRNHFEYRMRLIEAYAASDDGEAVRSNADALRERLGPGDDDLRARIAAAEAGVSASGEGTGATGADGNSLEFDVFESPEPRAGGDATGSGTVETGQGDANSLRFDLDDLDDGAGRGAILEVSDASEPAGGAEQHDLPMLELPDFETADAAGSSGGLQGVGDSDTSENGMKLSLAEAFVEMGDPEGALALLDEIMPSATAEQAAKAEQLRKQIGDAAD